MIYVIFGSSREFMEKPSITSITLKHLINVLLLLAATLLLITGFNFRHLSIQALEDQALAHAELVRAGLTAHMKADIMDKRDYYLDEIKQLHQINRLEIIRGEVVDLQFGLSRGLEKGMDAMAQQAFESGVPIFSLNEFSRTPSMRVIIPYIASETNALNCLACHQVDEGTVLGAVDIELDVTEHRNRSLWIISGMFVISLIFLVLILLNTSRTIQRYVQSPLDTLVDKARIAYNKQCPVSPDQFATQEFTNVANEINLFNAEIIANQDLLRQKNEELIALNEEIESTLRETVYTMGVIEEQRSKETSNHTQRVKCYSALLAKKMGLAQHDIDLIAAASPLHDIGKLGIPDEILFNSSKLDEQQHGVMESHTRIGYTMLNHSERAILKAGATIALQHHEKWDGTGYPQGLKAEEIHIYGRIVALSDVFDALFSERVYKEAWDIEHVISWIAQQRGKHFDPQLVDIFLDSIDEFIAISEEFSAVIGKKT